MPVKLLTLLAVLLLTAERLSEASADPLWLLRGETLPTADADTVSAADFVAAGEFVDRRLGVEEGFAEMLWRAVAVASRVIVCETDDAGVVVDVITLDRVAFDENE